MRRVARLRSLFEGESQPSLSESVYDAGERRPVSFPAKKTQLWFSVHFPDLCLEVLQPDSGAPCVVSDMAGQRSFVVAANDSARQAGIASGMSVNAACALVPHLPVLEREPERESAALEQFAERLTKFTPAISIVAPSALVLEVSRSLRIFGGLDSFGARLDSELTLFSHQYHVAGAPTARAASWLTRSGVQTIVASQEALTGVVSPLPLMCLGWDEKTLCALDQMGLETLGDCFRLPRDGFARRFGRQRLRELDEGMGRIPQALDYYDPPARFRAEVDFETEVGDSTQILERLDAVIGRLERFARRRQTGVSRLLFTFRHRRRPPTPLQVNLIQPATRATVLRDITALRLERVDFQAGVIGIDVRALLQVGCAGAQASLFAAGGDGSVETAPELVQRLSARLGAHAVQSIDLIAEHRPESAWDSRKALSDGPGLSTGPLRPREHRPLWVLLEPVRLDEAGDVPLYRGRLSIETGPERIETGWWDGHDIRRDYFQARSPSGEALWIYRELRTGSWFLHGFFA